MKYHLSFAAGAAVVLSLAGYFACLPSVCGAEAFGLKLMRPDSLVGWNYGETAPGSSRPAGWNITEGRLSGTSQSTPLLSGFSFGDFQLRLKWSVSRDGAWQISMPKAPDGPALQLILSDGPDCGRLTCGHQTLFAGVEIEPPTSKDAMHTAKIIRRGKTLSLSVDGKQIATADIPAAQYGLGLAVLRGSGQLEDLRVAEPPGHAMIADATLSNWHDKNKEAWNVENEELVLKPASLAYLRSNKQYANFVLSFQYKLSKFGNSGMAIRTPPGGWPSGDGLELQIVDQPPGVIDRNSQMGIYGNVRPLARVEKIGEWNDVVIKADGWIISAWENGELVQHYNTLHHPELKHRHLRGWVGPQDHRRDVRFRNLRILESPPGTGLDAWNKPQPPTAATAMIDRLINTESLSKNDHIQSGVVVKRIHGEAMSFRQRQRAKHLIADLRGPGAVVRVASLGKRGRLCFYFDGELDPRIECSPLELCEHVPQLNEDVSPVVTYLPYKKSLKILLRGAAEGDCVIDYVTFPEDMPIETFSGPTSTIPRGWLEPAAYRQNILYWGTHREHDPQLRVVSQRQTVYPGESRELAHVDGAGLVRWVKLLAWQDALESDDLWLSATIDGERQPAISAPARFWFPGLVVGGENFNNYLLLDRGGATNMLAMPFADGFTISAENHGRHAIDSIGIDLSVETATPQTRGDIVARARLRGVFVPAGKNSTQIFSQRGRGRWVGLVCQVPKDEKLDARFNLIVDGQRMKSWSDMTLDEFLGRSGIDFRKCLSGLHDGLAWRYMLLAPVDFTQSIQLDVTADGVGSRLALFYLFK